VIRGERRWWLPAVLVLPVSACSFGGAARCEKAFAANFGGGWQR